MTKLQDAQARAGLWARIRTALGMGVPPATPRETETEDR